MDAVDGRVITRFRTQKNAELLGYLAWHLQRAHAREELVELLWPESDLVRGRNRLSNALSSLRRQLEPPGVPAGAVLQTDRAFVRLNPAVVATDVGEFEAALQSAASASSQLERAQLLAGAVELYRGPLLPGCYADWLAPEQHRLAELHLGALLQLVDSLASLARAGELPRALEAARRAVAADPLREATHREVMHLYVAAGQPAAALQQYRHVQQLLKEELGTVPALATRTLAQKVQLQSAGGVDVWTYGGVDEGPDRTAAPTRPHFRASIQPPTGTVTFLLTDIEGRLPFEPALEDGAIEALREALASQQELLRGEFRRHGGFGVKEAGGSFLVAFASARDALEAAVAAQRRLADADFESRTAVCPDQAEAGRMPTSGSPNPQSAIRNPQWRTALHTADVELERGEYQGPALHSAARMLAAAHGGQILRSEAAAALLRRDLDPDVRLVDLGIYRLRDVPAPERLFQVAYPEMPRRRFPPLRAAAGSSGNLPPTFSRLFGREAELAALAALLSPETNERMDEWTSGRGEDVPESKPGPTASIRPLVRSSARLVTLTGPGGTGKTRLALEVARQLAERFSGAVWFVPLGDVERAERLPDAALAALRLPRAAQTEPFEQLVGALGAHPTLLVLDNFEQIVVDGAPLLQELLAEVPSLRCLVTSRQRLDVAGEREFPIQPLPRPGGSAGGSWTPEQLLAYESVQLFVDRAQAAKPDFQVTANNAAGIAELCDRLEGIPLAVELAAARVQILTVGQMLAQLARRFDFLVSRRRDLSHRHRTLRAALDWSYRLLSPELQRLFARLSVFRGGWTLAAAEAVCGGIGVMEYGSNGVMDTPDPPVSTTPPLHHSNTPPAPGTLDALEQLRACSLVLVDEAREGFRFRMLETLREYAAEKLAPEGREAVREQHATYYLVLAEAASEELRGPQQSAWLARLDLELPNLRAALEWTSRQAGAHHGLPTAGPTCGVCPRLPTGLRLAAALWRFWSTRGYSREGLAALRAALARLGPDHPELGRSVWRAEALNGAGALAQDLGDYGAARGFHEESLALWRELGDPVGEASALNNLGNLAFSGGESDAAGPWYEEALRLYRAAGDDAGTARVLSNLGALERERGNPARAAQLIGESLELRRALGDQFGLAVSLENLGHLERERGRPTGAAEHHAEALSLRRELDYKQGIAVSLNNLGILLLEAGDLAGAEDRFRESLALLREVTEPRATAECLVGLAGVAAAEGRHPQAARLLGAAAALRERSGITPSPVEASVEEQAARSALAALGEDAYAAARMEGKRLAPEQVEA